MTSAGQWLEQTLGAKNPDGSDNIAFVATGQSFKCNVQPAGGKEIPAPIALRNVSTFRLFVPPEQEPFVKNRVRVDGVDYEVHDVQDPRSADLVSKQLLLTLIQ